MPPNSHISSDEIQRITTDFEYYANRYIRIVNKAKSLQTLSLNNCQKILFAREKELIERGRPPRQLVLKFRQGGITTGKLAQEFWMVNTRPNQDAALITENQNKGPLIWQIVNRMYESLPDQIRPERHRKNKKMLELTRLHSRFYVGSIKVKTVLSGLTPNIIHFTEAALWDDDAVSTMTEAMQSVPRTGIVTIETTPDTDNEENWFFSAWKHARLHPDSSDFSALFLPWFVHEEYEMEADPSDIFPALPDEIKLLEENPWMQQYFPGGLSREQAARKIAWRRSKLRDLTIKNDMRLFWHSYPEDDENCWMSEGECPFNTDMLLIHEQRIRREGEGRVEQVMFGSQHTWVEPDLTKQYIMSIDPSRGVGSVGSDYTVVQIWAIDTMEQVFVWRGKMPPETVAQRLLSSLLTMWNDPFVIIEYEANGAMILRALVDAGYTNLFWHIDMMGGCPNTPGWKPTKENRAILMDCIHRHLSKTITIRSKYIIQQARAYRYMANKHRLDHMGMGHDDDLIAFGLAMAAKEQIDKYGWLHKKKANTADGEAERDKQAIEIIKKFEEGKQELPLVGDIDAAPQPEPQEIAA